MRERDSKGRRGGDRRKKQSNVNETWNGTNRRKNDRRNGERRKLDPPDSKKQLQLKRREKDRLLKEKGSWSV